MRITRLYILFLLLAGGLIVSANGDRDVRCLKSKTLCVKPSRKLQYLFHSSHSDKVSYYFKRKLKPKGIVASLANIVQVRPRIHSYNKSVTVYTASHRSLCPEHFQLLRGPPCRA